MWESEDLGSREILWTSTTFLAGFSRHRQAPCGALTAALICLGLRYRCPPEDKKQAAKGREAAGRDAHVLVESFQNKYGSISCQDLIGIDFSDPDSIRRWLENEMWSQTCDAYVSYIVAQLYDLAESRPAGTENVPSP